MPPIPENASYNASKLFQVPQYILELVPSMIEMDGEKRQEIARHYRDHPEEQPTAASDIDERIKDAWGNAMEILKYLK